MKKNDKCICCDKPPIMVLIMSFYTRSRTPRLAAHADSIAFCNDCLWRWMHEQLYSVQHGAIAAVTSLVSDDARIEKLPTKRKRAPRVAIDESDVKAILEMLHELRDMRAKP